MVIHSYPVKGNISMKFRHFGSVLPLSVMLNNARIGYQTKNQNHLLHMNNLNLFDPSKAQIKKLAVITAKFRKGIRMEFRLEKCSVVQLRAGDISDLEN